METIIAAERKKEPPPKKNSDCKNVCKEYCVALRITGLSVGLASSSRRFPRPLLYTERQIKTRAAEAHKRRGDVEGKAAALHHF